MNEELMAMIESLVQEHYGTQGLDYLRQRTNPAPAVQVPEADAIAAKWSAEWEVEPGKRRELKKLFVAALKEAAGND